MDGMKACDDVVAAQTGEEVKLVAVAARLAQAERLHEESRAPVTISTADLERLVKG